MKTKKTARDRRTEEAKKRRDHWNQTDPAPKPAPEPVKPAKPAVSKAEIRKQREADTREFLAYLEGEIVIRKEEPDPGIRKSSPRRALIADLNLEEGMPTVEEAVGRMMIGFQELRASGVRLVRVIHGYGSTGRGGKICVGVRKELSALKARRRIREFAAGEDFGPFSAESRLIAEKYPEAVRDPDYGRGNPGITVVML